MRALFFVQNYYMKLLYKIYKINSTDYTIQTKKQRKNKVLVNY